MCRLCKAEEVKDTDTCPQCGYPNAGTQVEKNLHLNRLGPKLAYWVRQRRHLKLSRTTIWVVMALQTLVMSIMVGKISSATDADAKTEAILYLTSYTLLLALTIGAYARPIVCYGVMVFIISSSVLFQLYAADFSHELLFHYGFLVTLLLLFSTAIALRTAQRIVRFMHASALSVHTLKRLTRDNKL